ncbi:hypothetical protein RvY_07360-1 [Ramazzottius varieornatus]|uniref:WAP domain-containing protein n=1 Tax=Ramazzottius varieornatus TaxID=947166 RepID=A0A1D1V1U9_RAMVA|nr:hypothetical protein RvY_07360-1 [Ramazzottius varieornatus]
MLHTAGTMCRRYLYSASIFSVLFTIVRGSDATRYSYHNDVTAAPINTTSGSTSYSNNGGFCPNNPTNAASCAAVQCLACNDSSCTGGQKCCSVRCCPVCTTLLASPPPSQKAGSCPLSSFNDVTCNGDINPDPVARDLCQNDIECPGDSKCCFNGCGQLCIAPEASSQSKSRSANFQSPGVKQKHKN